ncbi:hypothetical protein K1719_013548 [Acacia pycnantha]|nr:hypothetical protein K1719_013548 [Acacia pycnantha]
MVQGKEKGVTNVIRTRSEERAREKQSGEMVIFTGRAQSGDEVVVEAQEEELVGNVVVTNQSNQADDMNCVNEAHLEVTSVDPGDEWDEAMDPRDVAYGPILSDTIVEARDGDDLTGTSMNVLEEFVAIQIKLVGFVTELMSSLTNDIFRR